MKTIRTIILLTFFFPINLFCQIITEENFLKADKMIWETNEIESSKIFELMEKQPDKRDSLILVLKELNDLALRQNVDTAIKYAAVPSGLERLYMVRLRLTKDTLMTILNSLPIEMQESEYGVGILQHITHDQINEGDKYSDFDAVYSNGDSFKLSSYEGKTILLLYNGLDCMGYYNREVLKQIYDQTDRNNFDIIIYWSIMNLKDLQELKTKYSVDYKFISDFKGANSLFKIKYGAQARPTCFLIDKNGIVKLKTIGLPSDKLIGFLKNNEFE
jgi:peroxiredoxin